MDIHYFLIYLKQCDYIHSFHKTLCVLFFSDAIFQVKLHNNYYVHRKNSIMSFYLDIIYSIFI